MNSSDRNGRNRLRLVRLGIDTHQQAIAFMRRDCHVCRSEGFNAMSRVELRLGGRTVIATLDVVDERWLEPGVLGVSESTWELLGGREGELVEIAHPQPLESMAHVRARIFGHPLDARAMHGVIADVVAGRFSDVQLAAFITSCANGNFSLEETIFLTQAMVEAGERLHWRREPVLDKHSVGGLPGNRTTPLVVAIVAANGLCIPKTSSRSITSPAGTADTMETLTRVELSLQEMQDVVERENGCLVWGGSVNLSPADDILIRVERVLDIDGEGQLIASVLSKKIAAGASHVLIDIPVGPTAKVRSQEAAESLGNAITLVGRSLGLEVRPCLSDGRAPVGRGIGPALEARDLLAVLRNEPQAPPDLRQRGLELAAHLLEMGGKAAAGGGFALAEATLADGRAWRKFQAICEAQGGLREPPLAPCRHEVTAMRDGFVEAFDNRVLARLGKLAGAPAAPCAGIELAVRTGQWVHRGDTLFTLHAAAPGELAYALDYHAMHPDVIKLSETLP